MIQAVDNRDQLPRPAVSISSVRLNEGLCEFTIEREGAKTLPLRVELSLAGTAQKDHDFRLAEPHLEGLHYVGKLPNGIVVTVDKDGFVTDADHAVVLPAGVKSVICKVSTLEFKDDSTKSVVIKIASNPLYNVGSPRQLVCEIAKKGVSLAKHD